MNSNKIVALLRDLNDEDPAVRIQALQSCGTLDVPRSAFVIVLQSLSDRNEDVRCAAVESLGLIGRQEAVPSLLKMLRDQSSEIRMRAAESLGLLLAGMTCPKPLLKSLRDSDELVRIQAAQSLQEIGDRTVLPVLWRSLNDRSPLMRSYVAASIGDLGGKKDHMKLESRLRRETSDVSRLGYYEAFFKLGKIESLLDLLPLLHHSNYKIRCSTANVLSTLPLEPTLARLVLEALHRAR
ncbi:MAG: HEAT repeat domain-containing protein, partial [Terriglobia bacterium]